MVQVGEDPSIKEIKSNTLDWQCRIQRLDQEFGGIKATL
jgi:hypothetical protein